MFLRALVAFLALPGVFAIVLPYSIASADPLSGTGWTFGAIVMGCGGLVLQWCVRDFYTSGKGTPAPWHPPERLVVVGLYRHTRNPMYLGVLTLVGGWCILTGSPLLCCYLLVMALSFHTSVVFYEEPVLSKQFAGEWKAYSAAVPRWLPRLTPWNRATTGEVSELSGSLDGEGSGGQR